MTPEQLAVLRAIPWGKENIIIADQIAALAGIEKEKRTQFPTRKIIRELRKMGEPILSNNTGFWQSLELPEFTIVVRDLLGRGRSTIETAHFLIGTKTEIESGTYRQTLY